MSTVQAPDLVYICDWLPPDFGAVGQYSLMFATELAEQGQHVALVGLSSSGAVHESKSVGRGRLSIHKLDAQPYSKTRRGERLLWTLKTNTRLLRAAWPMIAAAKTVLFTGSPPMFLHWIAPANVVLRRKLVYRITDFHPECAIAELSHPPVWLRLAYWATLFWRRRVDEFEVLGHDQAQLLRDIGIADDRIRLKPDPSPVTITADTQPLPRPPGFEGKQLLLYSGNWGIAHNVQTFLDGYAAHHRQGTGRVVLWLNAVGSGADTVEETLRRYGLPFHHSQLVPIDDLGGLLVTPDAHLITLSDAFVGFVVPSKVHGCIASRKPLVFIGSERSDVHRLCWESGCDYTRVAAGDAAQFARTLEHLADLCEDASAATQLRADAAGPTSSKEQA
ncbi:MAG: hypothetical protein ABW200_16255 [Hyphomicrobiaceae bacterium]